MGRLQAAIGQGVGDRAALPMAAVEVLHRDRRDGPGLEAAHVDADAVGVGARHVERLDAAHPAEEEGEIVEEDDENNNIKKLWPKKYLFI